MRARHLRLLQDHHVLWRAERRFACARTCRTTVAAEGLYDNARDSLLTWRGCQLLPLAHYGDSCALARLIAVGARTVTCVCDTDLCNGARKIDGRLGAPIVVLLVMLGP